MSMSNGSNTPPRALESSLRDVAASIARAGCSRPGDIVLRLTGEGGGTYQLSGTRQGDVVVAETSAVAVSPLIEVVGDATAVRDILDGKVDARERYLAGGVRVSGDLRYLSELAMELDLLKHPL
ncbi:hypothetical protein ACWF94_10530 [Streptomyces sp. NPDC055078]